MRLLFDTQLLLWLIYEPQRLPEIAGRLIDNPANMLFFSAVSIWEIAIKQGLRKINSSASAVAVLAELETRGFVKVPLQSTHGIELLRLPSLHRDPFDRILVAQAANEALTLVTADKTLAAYSGAMIKV